MKDLKNLQNAAKIYFLKDTRNHLDTFSKEQDIWNGKYSQNWIIFYHVCFTTAKNTKFKFDKKNTAKQMRIDKPLFKI